MSEEKRDSTRTLLEEVEGGWSTPSSAKVPAAKAVETPSEAEEPAPVSTPTLDSLDAGWIDELFDEEDEEDEEEEPEESEPELPDEALDPVAYAAAKKAREEREEARREKRKAKAEAKKARRKARALAAQQGQKQKQKKRKTGGTKARGGKLPADARASETKRAPIAEAREADDEVDEAPAPRKAPPAAKLLAEAPTTKGPPWTLIAIGFAVFLAAAAAVATIASR